MKIKIFNLLILFFTCFFIINTNSISISQINNNSIEDYEFNPYYLNQNISKISEIIKMVNESLILGYLEDLVEFSPRNTGSYGCEKAGEYIYDKFVEMGIDTKIYNWASFGNRYNPRFFSGQNIEATIYGNNKDDEIIIFNAHYDSVKVSPGADDDGSGVAAVLAAAYVLSKFEFDRTVKFLCFSGEEEGLLGSKNYSKYVYENNDVILVEFNADMIGYADKGEDENKFRIYGTNDIGWYVDIIENLNIQYDFNFDISRRILSEDSRGGSDYYSFSRYGYECIAFFEGQWNQNMHTRNDNIENMNIPYLKKTSQLIIASIAYILDMSINHPFIFIESPQKGFLYFEGRKIKNLEDKKDDQLRTIIIDDIWIWVDVLSEINPIDRVEFYYNDRLQYTDIDYPYKWEMNKISFFNHRIKVIVYDVEGNTASNWMDVLFINPRIRN
jgi:aminopeptidase YwaD